MPFGVIYPVCNQLCCPQICSAYFGALAQPLRTMCFQIYSKSTFCVFLCTLYQRENALVRRFWCMPLPGDLYLAFPFAIPIVFLWVLDFAIVPLFCHFVVFIWNSQHLFRFIFCRYRIQLSYFLHEWTSWKQLHTVYRLGSVCFPDVFAVSYLLGSWKPYFWVFLTNYSHFRFQSILLC